MISRYTCISARISITVAASTNSERFFTQFWLNYARVSIANGVWRNENAKNTLETSLPAILVASFRARFSSPFCPIFLLFPSSFSFFLFFLSFFLSFFLLFFFPLFFFSKLKHSYHTEENTSSPTSIVDRLGLITERIENRGIFILFVAALIHKRPFMKIPRTLSLTFFFFFFPSFLSFFFFFFFFFHGGS